jgi:Uma2 family endonuclease
MVTYVYEDEQISVPSSVVDLESFRRWADSNEFPENGRIWWLKGEVWVDMSKEQIFSHVLVKTELAIVLGMLVKTGQLGLFLTDGAFLSNIDADIAGIPDAVFVSRAALLDQVRVIEGKREGYVELQGSPDMVLEVLSRGSVQKDTIILRRAYWEAGIREYWLVDARQEPLKFDILRHTAKGYAATRKQDGWMKSAVFGKTFRLTQQVNLLGHPEYTLEAR